MGRKMTVRPGQEKNGLYITQVIGTGSTALLTVECRDCKTTSRLTRQTWSYGTPVCKSCKATESLFAATTNRALVGDCNGTFYLVDAGNGDLDLQYVSNDRENTQLKGKLTHRLVKLKTASKFIKLTQADSQDVDLFTRPPADEAYYAVCPVKAAWVRYFVEGLDESLSPEEENLANETFLEYVLPNDEIPDFTLGSATQWVENGTAMQYIYVRTRGFAQLKDPRT